MQIFSIAEVALTHDKWPMLTNQKQVFKLANRATNVFTNKFNHFQSMQRDTGRLLPIVTLGAYSFLCTVLRVLVIGASREAFNQRTTLCKVNLVK